MLKKLKKNKSILIIILVALFIVSGLVSKDFVLHCGSAGKNLYIDVLNMNPNCVKNVENKLGGATTRGLSYYGPLMDAVSFYNRVLGKKVIQKDNLRVIKSDSGKLVNDCSQKLEASDISQIVNNIKQLEEAVNNSGIDFLYIAVPPKEYYEQVPANCVNYAPENYQEFMNALKSSNISLFDMSECLKHSANENDLFFVTDHHWKPTTAFFAAGEICKEMNNRFGFEYNEAYTDINHYNIETYSHYFLGTLGQKTGAYFTQNGLDDFDIITPKFNTNMVEEQPIKGEKREGSFEDTVLFKENLTKKQYYHNACYATYSGGDFRIQIMKNLDNKDGKKVLLIRDSFACAVAPFLCLQTKELHVCDIRNFEGFVGETIDVQEYINQIKPDYVLVLYSDACSIADSYARYEFLSNGN